MTAIINEDYIQVTLVEILCLLEWTSILKSQIPFRLSNFSSESWKVSLVFIGGWICFFLWILSPNAHIAKKVHMLDALFAMIKIFDFNLSLSLPPPPPFPLPLPFNSGCIY